MKQLGYKTVKDTFVVSGIEAVESVMVFNNGLKTVEIENLKVVKAGYGIRLKYLDNQGVGRCVYGYGWVEFFDVEENLCELTVSTGGEISVENYSDLVQVVTKITLYNNNV